VDLRSAISRAKSTEILNEAVDLENSDRGVNRMEKGVAFNRTKMKTKLQVGRSCQHIESPIIFHASIDSVNHSPRFLLTERYFSTISYSKPVLFKLFFNNQTHCEGQVEVQGLLPQHSSAPSPHPSSSSSSFSPSSSAVEHGDHLPSSSSSPSCSWSGGVVALIASGEGVQDPNIGRGCTYGVSVCAYRHHHPALFKLDFEL
jgi:hypothetical protein